MTHIRRHTSRSENLSRQQTQRWQKDNKFPKKFAPTRQRWVHIIWANYKKEVWIKNCIHSSQSFCKYWIGIKSRWFVLPVQGQHFRSRVTGSQKALYWHWSSQVLILARVLTRLYTGTGPHKGLCCHWSSQILILSLVLTGLYTNMNVKLWTMSGS